MKESRMFVKENWLLTVNRSCVMGVFWALSLVLPMSLHAQESDHRHHVTYEEIRNPYHDYLVRHMRNLRNDISDLRGRIAELQRTAEQMAQDINAWEAEDGKDKTGWRIAGASVAASSSINLQEGLERKEQELRSCRRKYEEVPEYIDRSERAYWNGKITGYKEQTARRASNPGAQSCFVATAAYGTAFENEVVILRRFRDTYLLANPAGELFVDIYYRTSPPIADFIRLSERRRQFTRMLLTPVVEVAKWSLEIPSPGYVGCR